MLKWILPLVILLILGVVFFLKMPKANIDNVDAVANLQSSSLYEYFEKNEVEANKTYFGKIIEVTGKVYEVTEDEKGSKVVLISSTGKPEVLVTLQENQKTKLKGYKVNDPISVKAQCNGMLMEVTMSKGIILD